MTERQTPSDPSFKKTHTSTSYLIHKHYGDRVNEIYDELRALDIEILMKNDGFTRMGHIRDYICSINSQCVEHFLSELTQSERRLISDKLLELSRCKAELEDSQSSARFSYFSNLIHPNEKALYFYRISCLKIGKPEVYKHLTNEQMVYSPIMVQEALKHKRMEASIDRKLILSFLSKSMNPENQDFKFLKKLLDAFLLCNANHPAFPKISTTRDVIIFPSLSLKSKQMVDLIRKYTSSATKVDKILIFFDALLPLQEIQSYITNLTLVLALKVIFPSEILILGVGHPIKADLTHYSNFKEVDSDVFHKSLNAARASFKKLLFVNDELCTFVCDTSSMERLLTLKSGTKFAECMKRKINIYPWLEADKVFIALCYPEKKIWLSEYELIELSHDDKVGFIPKILNFQK